MFVYLLLYVASFLFSRIQMYGVSGIALIFASLYLYLGYYRKMGSLLNLRGLFSLGFVGGQGISALKLSYLETDWAGETWCVLFLAYTCFWLAYEMLDRHKKITFFSRTFVHRESKGRVLLYAIIVLSVLSVMALLIEVIIVGYLPIFMYGIPHAYSAFHVSGLHYFTVLCVLVPACSIIYVTTREKIEKIDKAILILCSFLCLLIPILIVSRFQFILALGLALFSFMLVKRESVKVVFLIGLCMLPVYILLTVFRSHSVAYLNSIFEMKINLPIFISQPYIYIANNYDNLDTLIKELPRYSMGLKQLYPVWGLTGLKFIFPSLVDFPIYVTKTELTTVTLFYDAYYDFGVVGITLLSSILGGICYAFEHMILHRCPVFVLLYAQLAMYMILSFFTTWFSNPATWFYIAVTVIIIYLEVRYDCRKDEKGIAYKFHDS